MRFILIHSPLVSELTWVSLSCALETCGFELAVISLENITSSTETHHEHHVRQIEAALDKLPNFPHIFVAHSGAGTILAGIQPNRVKAYVFLDAMFPVNNHSRFELFDDPRLADNWRSIAHSNNELIPANELRQFGQAIDNGDLRELFMDSLADVPLGLYEQKIPVRPDWPLAGGLYLQWTDAYHFDAERAKEAGLDVRVNPASHFEMINNPEQVALTLADFARSLE